MANNDDVDMTPKNKKKPKEFWIPQPEAHLYRNEISHSIHVIEKSAYDDLEKDRDHWREAAGHGKLLFRVRKMTKNFRDLEKKYNSAIEALKSIANTEQLVAIGADCNCPEFSKDVLKELGEKDD